MKKLLFLFALAGLALTTQAKVLTTTIAGRPAMVYLPKDYTAGKVLPILLAQPGKGEAGNNVALLKVHGPFQYITDATDLGLQLIIVEIQPVYAYPVPDDIQAFITAVRKLYGTGNIIGTGLSAGASSWMWYAFASENNFKQIKALALLSTQPEAGIKEKNGVQRQPSWFEKYSVYYWGMCGTTDSFWENQKGFFNAVKSLSPGLASWTEWKGVGHSDPVWSDAYNPAWRSNDNKLSLYEWAVKVAGTSASIPPVINPPVTTVPAVKEIMTIKLMSDSTFKIIQ